MIFKNFKWIGVILALALSVLCMGCSGSDDSTTSEQDGDFHHTPEGEVQAKIKDLKLLLPEKVYNTITAKSLNNSECVEKGNGEELDLPKKENGELLPNGQWYYTYDNLITGMAELDEFADEGDENTKKLEIAAFLANIAQETGAKVVDDPFGSPGCAIQEGYGAEAAWHDCAFGQRPGEPGSLWGCNITRPFDCPTDPRLCPGDEVGYFGRGPHQLTHDVNYKAFGETMGVGDKYLNDPDLLTTNPEIGIAGSIWFWGHEEVTQWSPPDIPFKPSAHNVVVGKWKPTNSSTPGVGASNDVKCGRTEANFGVIINLINGGVECGPGARNPEAAKNRVEYLKAIAKEMGVDIPDGFLDNCSTQENFNCSSY